MLRRNRTLETTQSCALACRHCRVSARPGRDPGELTFEEGLRLVDQVADMSTPILILFLEEMAAFVQGLGIVFWEVFFLVPMGRGSVLSASECERDFARDVTRSLNVRPISRHGRSL